MLDFVKRIIYSLAGGYILMFFSELVFWSSYDPEGMTPIVLLVQWIMYSLYAYILFIIVSHYRVRSVWAWMIAGATYGWLLEGIAAPTLYGASGFPFPITISWTGLAWHMLIDVVVGIYLIRIYLDRNARIRVLVVSILIGIFWGMWGLNWVMEENHRVQQLVMQGALDIAVVHFAMYAIVSGAIAVVAYTVMGRMHSFTFAPTAIERWFMIGLTAVAFAVIILPAIPWAALILVPLLFFSWTALKRNRSIEPNDIPPQTMKPSGLNYLFLSLIPIVAAVTYAILLPLGTVIPFGIIILVLSTLAGFIAYIRAALKILRSHSTR